MATEQTVPQEEAVQVESTVPNGADIDAPPQRSEGDQVREKRDGKKEGTAQRDREPGKSVLPFTRVQKIIKADKDLPMVAKDATFLISLATEEFIKRLSQGCQRLAEREKRTTIQQKDVGRVSLFPQVTGVLLVSQPLVAHIVRRAEEFLFLEEIIGSQESAGRRKPQKARADVGAPGDKDQQSTLRSFMQRDNEDGDPGETSDIVMNEDGAMYAA